MSVIALEGVAADLGLFPEQLPTAFLDLIQGDGIERASFGQRRQSVHLPVDGLDLIVESLLADLLGLLRGTSGQGVGLTEHVPAAVLKILKRVGGHNGSAVELGRVGDFLVDRLQLLLEDVEPGHLGRLVLRELIGRHFFGFVTALGRLRGRQDQALGLGLGVELFGRIGLLSLPVPHQRRAGLAVGCGGWFVHGRHLGLILLLIAASVAQVPERFRVGDAVSGDAGRQLTVARRQLGQKGLPLGLARRSRTARRGDLLL